MTYKLTKEDFKKYYRFSLKIVRGRSRRFLRHSKQLKLDAVEEGLLGITDGILNFKNDRDCSLDSFIFKCMENRISTFIMNYNNKNLNLPISLEEHEIDAEEISYCEDSRIDSFTILNFIDDLMINIKNQHDDLHSYYHKHRDILISIYEDGMVGNKDLNYVAKKFNITRQAIDMHRNKLLAHFRFKIRERYGAFKW